MFERSAKFETVPKYVTVQYFRNLYRLMNYAVKNNMLDDIIIDAEKDLHSLNV